MSKNRGRHKRRDVEFLETSLRQNGKAAFEGPKKKKWSTHDLKTIKPLTPTQNEMFHAFFNNEHVCAYGTAGTGKTWLGNNPRIGRDIIVNTMKKVTGKDIPFVIGKRREGDSEIVYCSSSKSRKELGWHNLTK